MVFFCCNACGQSVKKNAVEKHWQTECARCWILSCLDCGKDFVGDDYKTHTSCVTEAEKYQGDLFKGEKGGISKGEKKQQEWLESVSACLQAGTYSPRISLLLKKILQYPNIPRKKAKFQNFVKNSINVHDQGTLDSLWDIFHDPPKTQQAINTPTESAPDVAEGKMSEEKTTIKVEVKTGQDSTPQLGIESGQTVKRKGKKRKKSECEDEDDYIVLEIIENDEKNLGAGNESNDQTVKRKKKKRKKSKCEYENDLHVPHEIKSEKKEEPKKPAKKKKKKAKKKESKA